MVKLNICVGSLNPTKINAVQVAFSRYFKNYRVYSTEVDSKVSNQPIGLKNIIEGAINRANHSLNYMISKKKIQHNIFGVGIEAGLVEVPYTKSGFMDFQFCAIINENEKISLGSGIAFEYPKFVIDQILQDNDTEIGEIIGNLAGNANLKNESGAISFLSKNTLTRTEILIQAVICALLPFINRELYNMNKK
ncbi:MAG: inosine/xanthosine triphosphatase [Promethearchaeota archaeon]|nr:MAG: inosine/xanthosine triphosphatase [Candidatus Lokiarchaeota archaeon]